MGWNTSALFLRDATATSAVAALGSSSPAGDVVGVDEATSTLRPDLLFAAEAGGWAEVWNPGCDLAPAYRPAGKETALTVIFSSVASTYGFTLYENGELRRQYVVSDGTPAVDEGVPLPAEATIEIPSWGPDEDFIWAVITAVTGAGYDETRAYQPYESGAF